ncbi:MAG TPA: ABC transporter permease [Actinomycetota bacterium]|jgi:peptide/nickel transport system permease protein
MRGIDYVLKRTGFALVTIFVAVTINFVLFRALPGDTISNLSKVPGATPALRAELTKEFGLDRSKWDQYWIYLRQLATGNLGVSFSSVEPVRSEVARAVANTIPMVFVGTLFAIGLGTVTGVLAAWKRRTVVDYGSVSAALIFYSLPTHWLGLMLLLLTAGYLPRGGREDEFLFDPTFVQHWVDVGKHMLLPSLTLGLVLYGQYTLVTRSAMLETLGEDFILTARAKGLADRTIVRRHAFRNAMLPVITLVALSLGYIVAGSILIETVFSWPGVGLLVSRSVERRDWPVLQGAFLILTISVVFFNYVADLLYFRLDPRITA